MTDHQTAVRARGYLGGMIRRRPTEVGQAFQPKSRAEVEETMRFSRGESTLFLNTGRSQEHMAREDRPCFFSGATRSRRGRGIATGRARPAA